MQRNPLAAFLDDREMRAGDFCRLRTPPFPPSLVSDWLAGRRSPSYFSMCEIERATAGKVPVSAWPVKQRKRARRTAA